MEALIAAGSLLVSAALAVLQIVNWARDKRSRRVSQLLKESNADERRDSVVVDSAERAVTLLERTLNSVSNDAEALRVRVRELEALVTKQALQIEDLKTEVTKLKRTS